LVWEFQQTCFFKFVQLLRLYAPTIDEEETIVNNRHRQCKGDRESLREMPQSVNVKPSITSSEQRHALKCATELRAIHKQLDEIFLGHESPSSSSTLFCNHNSHVGNGIHAVVITIGPSYLAPKEQYIIKFDNPMNDMKQQICPHHVSDMKQSISRACSRELIRATMTEVEFLETSKSNQQTENHTQQSERASFPRANSRLWNNKLSIALLCQKQAYSNFHQVLPVVVNHHYKVGPIRTTCSAQQFSGSQKKKVTFQSLKSHRGDQHFSKETPKEASQTTIRHSHLPFLVLCAIHCPQNSYYHRSIKVPFSDDDYLWLSLKAYMKGFR